MAFAVDGYWDPFQEQIIVEEIAPQGGSITIAGEILSTGNGQLKVANGYTSVDIINDSRFALVLDRIDTTTLREGKITLINTESLEKTEYTVAGTQIRETRSQGQLQLIENTGGDDFPGIVFTDLAVQPGLHEFSDTITYATTPDLQYVWTEGQEKTRVVTRTYEDNSFNVFGDNASAEIFANDNSFTQETVVDRDDEPLLESEFVAAEGQRDSDNNLLVPTQANGNALSVNYLLTTDQDVDLITDTTRVMVVTPNTDTPPPLDFNNLQPLIDFAQGFRFGDVYKYIGDPSEAILPDIDFVAEAAAADPDWELEEANAKFKPDFTDNKYRSDFLNFSIEQDGPRESGGGWLREKTITTVITTTTGIKDFYTLVLKQITESISSLSKDLIFQRLIFSQSAISF